MHPGPERVNFQWVGEQIVSARRLLALAVVGLILGLACGCGATRCETIVSVFYYPDKAHYDRDEGLLRPASFMVCKPRFVR